MTQISRPLQIALGAVVLLAAVWFIALRGHSSSSESSAPAPAATSASASSAASSSPAASQSASGGTGGSSQASKTYHGSAPGVGGLTRAIQKARGAATASEQNAKALQQKATQASGGTSATQTQQANSSAASSAGKSAASHSTAKTHSAAAGAGASAKAKAPVVKTTPTKTANGVPVMQARVEGELKRGDVVALLFWNPHGTVDATVRRELQSASHKLHGKLAIHVARANQVGSFGSFTRTVQVYSTPTILLVNTHAKTASLAGLTDVFSIEQAVREVKSAK